MKRLAFVCCLLAVALLVTASTSAAPQPNPTIAQVKAKNRALRLANADLQDEVDALNAVNGDQANQIQRLQNRIANTPDPIDAITSRGPDGLWSAMISIWQAFPRLDPSQLCGYDKNQSPGTDTGLSLTTFQFSRWSGC